MKKKDVRCQKKIFFFFCRMIAKYIINQKLSFKIYLKNCDFILHYNKCNND